jgi:hypothetical protein
MRYPAAALLAVSLGLGTVPVAARRALPVVHEGDLIFQVSRSSQSAAIQLATHSRYSHMGVVLFVDGQPNVFEAVARVRYTPLRQWIARGEDGHFVIKRLRSPEVLTGKALTGLRHIASRYDGRSYDPAFGWSDERIYCSELVWKLFDEALGLRIGSLQKLGELDLSPPPVRQKLRERYGAKVPLEERVISPQAMFDSPLLETVTEG